MIFFLVWIGLIWFCGWVTFSSLELADDDYNSLPNRDVLVVILLYLFWPILVLAGLIRSRKKSKWT